MSDALSNGWEIRSDVPNKKSYYYHELIGSTSDKDKIQEMTSFYNLNYDTRPKPFYVTINEKKQGWRRHYSKNHGKWYLYNDITGESKWNEPLETAQQHTTVDAQDSLIRQGNYRTDMINHGAKPITLYAGKKRFSKKNRRKSRRVRRKT